MENPVNQTRFSADVSGGQAADFVAVQSSNDSNNTVETLTSSASCRVTLPCGAVFELFSPITAAELSKLLVAIQSR